MYYKIQFFDVISICWKDIQKSFDSIDNAVSNFPNDKKCRVISIDGKKRIPIHFD